VVFWSVTISLLVMYGAICLSPMRKQIGRKHPGIAALLSPPWFNFDADYDSGSVLNFQLGMNRLELEHIIARYYVNNSVLRGGCGDNGKIVAPDIAIGSVESSELIQRKGVVCLWNKSKRLSVILSIPADSLSKVRVTVDNWGL
jgi:hypothetical protein